MKACDCNISFYTVGQYLAFNAFTNVTDGSHSENYENLLNMSEWGTKQYFPQRSALQKLKWNNRSLFLFPVIYFTMHFDLLIIIHTFFHSLISQGMDQIKGRTILTF